MKRLIYPLFSLLKPGKMDNLKIKKLENIGDLEDERARALAKRFQVGASEIWPTYVNFLNRAKDNKGDIFIDTNDPNILLNVHQTHQKELACGAIISYEFTKADAIEFPGHTHVFLRVPVQHIPTETHEEFYGGIAKKYEEIIALLERHRIHFLEKMLGGG
jgi:hypothetical protein